MLISISWRNVWRNKFRSLIIIFATIIGICAGIFAAAFYTGMADQRIEKAINNEISHIQIHEPDFREANEITKYIPNADQLTDNISKMPEVTGVSKRMVIYSMIASAETGSGVKISGIEPEMEKQTTKLYEKIKEGSYFEEKRKNQVIIGSKLAEKLKVKLGSKVVITLQDVDNNITAGAFRVTGIFSTSNNMFDESNVFVRFSDLAQLTNFPKDACHEIAILAKSNDGVDALQHKIEAKAPKLEVMSWLQISPEMEYLTESMDLYNYIFIFIILLALLFGIINTMLMVVLERIKEIGMLMAIGMNKARIFGMIVYETIFLSITGGIAGVLFGMLITRYFETHKIDLSIWGEAYENLGYDSFVYTTVDWNMIISVTIMVIFTGFIGSLYPAYKALQNDPADALRIE